MDHFVTLDRLPEGLTFPPDLAEQLHFDGERRRLSFRGFMSKADYDRILELSEDWAFRRKLEELFRLCVAEDPRPRGRHGPMTAVAVGALLAALIGLGWIVRHTWPTPAGRASPAASAALPPPPAGTIASAHKSP